MGNCLKNSSADDISLLRGNEMSRESLSSQHEPNPVPDYADVFNQYEVFQHNVPINHQPSNNSYTQSYSSSSQINTATSNIGGGFLSDNLHQEMHQSEEQIRVAKRIGLIQHLPMRKHDGGFKNSRECVICMVEFVVGDTVRYLPCMHTYHLECIDDWLMRSLTCPSCMEPVDAALLTSYETN